MKNVLNKIYKCFKKEEQTKEFINIVEPYGVKINVGLLIVRKGPGNDYEEAGVVKENNSFVIIEEAINKDGEVWGLLKAFKRERNGWINLKYTQKK